MDLIRALFQRLGARYVQLVDFDGEHHIRRVVWRGGQACAWRHGMGIALVMLLDEGEVDGTTYVKKWKPYDPSAAKLLPTPPSEKEK